MKIITLKQGDQVPHGRFAMVVVRSHHPESGAASGGGGGMVYYASTDEDDIERNIARAKTWSKDNGADFIVVDRSGA